MEALLQLNEAIILNMPELANDIAEGAILSLAGWKKENERPFYISLH